MNYEQIMKEKLSPARANHSMRVAATAAQLAAAHGIHLEKAKIAGLLHDYCKEYPKEILVEIAVESQLVTSRDDLWMPQILHGPVASVVLKKEGLVSDPEILEAVRYHTTGHPDMGELAKIIFIADYIEPGRKTPGISGLQEIALKSLDQCIVQIVDKTVDYLLSENRLIHEDMIKLRNKILMKG